jgi:hydroxyacylglutathione hydrolase
VSLHVHVVPLGIAIVYLLENEYGYYLIDAGPPRYEENVLHAMREIGGKDLKLIFITHAHVDHYGSAAAIRRQTGASITIHKADREALANAKTEIGSARGRGRLTSFWLPWALRFLRPEPIQPDLTFTDGQSLTAFGLDAYVLHTPGHTPGSSSLIVENRLAFVGDLLTTRGSPHLQNLYAHDWSQLPASLRRLQSLNLEWIYTGHGHRPMSGEEVRAIHP